MLTKIRDVVTTVCLVALVFMGIYWFTTDTRAENDNEFYWISCIAAWGDAASQRNTVLNAAIEFEALQEGIRDEAMSVLVNNRNVDTAATAEAVREWNEADADVEKAKSAVAQAREDYPPPLLKDYCTRLKSIKLPKAQGTPPPKSPSPTPSSPKAGTSQGEAPGHSR